jgi:hypothetical protein
MRCKAQGAASLQEAGIGYPQRSALPPARFARFMVLLKRAGRKKFFLERGVIMPQLKGLCGKRYCPRICASVCRCPAGKARELYLLNLQALRRLTRNLEKRGVKL